MGLERSCNATIGKTLARNPQPKPLPPRRSKEDLKPASDQILIEKHGNPEDEQKTLACIKVE
jgi:hypothetical protein